MKGVFFIQPDPREVVDHSQVNEKASEAIEEYKRLTKQLFPYVRDQSKLSEYLSRRFKAFKKKSEGEQEDTNREATNSHHFETFILPNLIRLEQFLKESLKSIHFDQNEDYNQAHKKSTPILTLKKEQEEITAVLCRYKLWILKTKVIKKTISAFEHYNKIEKGNLAVAEAKKELKDLLDNVNSSIDSEGEKKINHESVLNRFGDYDSILTRLRRKLSKESMFASFVDGLKRRITRCIKWLKSEECYDTAHVLSECKKISDEGNQFSKEMTKEDLGKERIEKFSSDVKKHNLLFEFGQFFGYKPWNRIDFTNRAGQPSHFYLGRAPQQKDIRAIKVGAIKRGRPIKLVIRLIQEFENKPHKNYHPGDWGNDVKFVDIPMPDHTAQVDLEKVKDAIAKMQSTLADGDGVYIHCELGRGRSNFFACCFLVIESLMPAFIKKGLLKLCKGKLPANNVARMITEAANITHSQRRIANLSPDKKAPVVAQFVQKNAVEYFEGANSIVEAEALMNEEIEKLGKDETDINLKAKKLKEELTKIIDSGINKGLSKETLKNNCQIELDKRCNENSLGNKTTAIKEEIAKGLEKIISDISFNASPKEASQRHVNPPLVSVA